MANRVWITEFAAGRVEAAASFAQLPALASEAREPIDLSDGASKTFTTNAQTRYIRIVSEAQCALSTDSKATVNDILLPALTPEYFGIPGGASISVILVP